MKNIIAMTIVLAALTGCGQENSAKMKQEAQSRWYHTRAQVLCSLAAEHLKGGQLDNAQSKAQEALSLDAENVTARTLLGKIHIEQGRYMLAVDELSKAQEKQPQSAEAAYLLGVAQEKAGRLDDALLSYQRSESLDANKIAAVVAAGEVLAVQGKTDEARQHVESHLANAGNEPGIYELAGRLAMMQKDYTKATDYYQHARDLDCKNLSYVEALATAQFLSGRYELAQEDLEALTRDPAYASRPSIYSMLGDCYMATGHMEQARDAHLKAAEMNPSDPGGWTNLARAALALGDLPRAVVAARQALSLDEKSLDATLLLGYALLREGQITPSLGVLTAAVAAHPESAELLCVLGRAHGAAGDEAEAARCYAAALRLDPDSTLARALLTGKEVRTLSMVR